MGQYILFHQGGLAMLRSAFRLTLTGALLALALPARAADGKTEAKPEVEVVFCLDTTGSMGGLIKAAKEKIWTICNQIASGKPTPRLKVGLVAYRDKGDEYITKVFDLTDDLDAIHGHLKGFVAAGGGDEPEHVNLALYDAVHKIKWSTDKKTLRMIFLVGDAEPHMDYKDDVKYPDTCKVACEKAIIINTVQCGNSTNCEKHWKEICKLAEGSYVKIPQDGGATPVVKTPYDKELVEINAELTKSTLVYGRAEQMKDGKEKNKEAKALAPEAAAARGAYLAKNGMVATYDLLDCINSGKVKLDELKDDELPAELKKLTPKERKEYLEKIQQKRTELNKKALELDKKRADFIAKKQAEDAGKGKNAFDGEVLEVLRKQAKRVKIDY
jgi:Mg-chelatase subunit ChlD